MHSAFDESRCVMRVDVTHEDTVRGVFLTYDWVRDVGNSFLAQSGDDVTCPRSVKILRLTERYPADPSPVIKIKGLVCDNRNESHCVRFYD